MLSAGTLVSDNLGDLDHDFTEMTTPGHICEGLFRFIKREDSVDNRSDPCLLVEANNFVEAIFRTIPDALEGDIPSQSEHIRVGPVTKLILFAAKVSDAGDETPPLDASKALRQCRRSALLEDDVRAFATRDLHDSILPFRIGPVIDKVVSPEFLRFAQLIVRRGGDDSCYGNVSSDP